MGYSIVGKFYYKEELVSECILDCLKNINRTRYDADFEYLEPSSYKDGKGIYTVKDFANARYKVFNLLTKNIIYKEKLETIRNSAEYYKLTSEQKDDYIEDINTEEEMIDELEHSYHCLVEVIGIFEYLSSSFKEEYEYKSEDDFSVEIYAE